MPQLAALFVVVQIVEIWLLIQVGQAIGGWQTLVLLIADSLLGAWLLRREGRRTWRAFRLALQERRVPAREVADGVLVIFGGALLLTPGFLSDILGALFLLPPTRALIRKVFLRRAMSRITVTMAGAPMPPRGSRRSDDVEGTAVDVDPRPRSPRPGLEA